jgi:hypothetical protein
MKRDEGMGYTNINFAQTKDKVGRTVQIRKLIKKVSCKPANPPDP